jgi:alpha-glucosidase/alpha-D-xyloside xylohydrolase
MKFALPRGPLLGLGQGGPQFDRKGQIDQGRNGQGGYQLRTHGGRARVQWLVGTDGWGMFIHLPYGTFDMTGADGIFTPRDQLPNVAPLDVFVAASRDPLVLMREYAGITGFPELPAKWTLAYMQSHRTLAGPEEVLRVARTFREKKLPVDTVIYLGTEFTPSGWNTRNGEYDWNPNNFPDPKGMVDQLHALNLKVVLHTVIEGRRLIGTVNDPCTAPPIPPGRLDGNWPQERYVSCYWPSHKPVWDVGIDGWWPDQGDGYDESSRIARHRMYWEGTQQFKPNQRPFALHRNGAPGMARFGAFLWSGDVQTTWLTLATHVPVAVNTGLSGIPYWGTDIGGFVPTAEYTGELHTRWFQFGTFCTSFRSHGRYWHLRLPWGWNTGEAGPAGDGRYPIDPAELHNAEVEPVIKKYLELRYRLMPYTYTAVKETTETGLPVMRSLWLHYPDDPAAVARGDEYLWGRDILVAPVVEKGATVRKLYLPRGVWYDFWTEQRSDGGREIERAVDLATMPLFVRAGAIIPLDPVRQYVDEPVTEPMTLVVFPGANGTNSYYEDDGRTFDYRQGEMMRIAMSWEDATRRLTLRLAPGTRMLPPASRQINVRLAGQAATRSVTFAGQPVTVQL